MNKYKDYVFIFLLFIGVYFPSSIGMEIKSSFMWTKLIMFLTVSLLLIIKQKKIRTIFMFSFLSVISILLISTLFSGAVEYSFGRLGFILCLLLLFCIDFKNISLSPKVIYAFAIFNIITISIGYLIVIDNAAVNNFIIDFYSAHKDYLVYSMIGQHKPVLTFGTHSVAALFIFYLFYINFKHFMIFNKKISLVFSILYIILEYFLHSNTGYVFLIAGLAHVVYYAFHHIKRKHMWKYLFSIAMLLILFNGEISNFMQLLILNMGDVWSSPINGIAGRFGDRGALQVNFEYIASHPLNPIGFGYLPDLYYTDSGFVEYILRGSFTLPLIIYISLFLFLKKNVISKSSSYTIYCTFVMMDIFAYPLYTDATTFYILSFMILILNSFERYRNLQISN